jgi:phosphotransferase system enzyme I (PtsI)
MVTDVTDLERMREMIGRAAVEAPGVDVELGVMIETPAASLMADELAAAADFLSLGTNDLTQYVLAVDRSNADLAALYQPLHPAVIRLVRAAIAASIRRRTPVAVCGEAASDPRAVPLFVGMGVRELSVHPSAVPAVKTQVRRLSTDVARALVEEIAALPTAAAVFARIEAAQEREMGQCTPDA